MLTINAPMLKALASGTRRDILSALKARNGIILTDLARALGKHITTVKEHLQVLEDAGLVTRDKRPGRKFVFYSLSRQGARILLPYVSDVSVLFLVGFLVMAAGITGVPWLGPVASPFTGGPVVAERELVRGAPGPSATPTAEPGAAPEPLAKAPAAEDLADEGTVGGAMAPAPRALADGERAAPGPMLAAPPAGEALSDGAAALGEGAAAELKSEAGPGAPAEPEAAGTNDAAAPPAGAGYGSEANAPAAAASPAGSPVGPRHAVLAIGVVAMAWSLAVSRRRASVARAVRALPDER